MVAPVKAIPVGAVVVSVPPQTVAEAFATVKPVGSVSVKATPVKATAFAAGFVIVNVSEVVAFSAMLDGLKTLAIDGGATTLMLAEAVPPVPPSVEVTLPVVLFCKPAAIPVTFTANVQEAVGGNRSAAQADHVRALRCGNRSATARASEAVRRRDHQACRQSVAKAYAGQRRAVVVLNGKGEARWIRSAECWPRRMP